MIPIKLKPTLSKCVETLAKREYRESLQGYMASAENSEALAEKIELLRLFLETADFSKLRAESEKWLSAGKSIKFILRLENGKPKTKLILE